MPKFYLFFVFCYGDVSQNTLISLGPKVVCLRIITSLFQVIRTRLRFLSFHQSSRLMVWILISNALMRNPDWRVQLAKVELVRAKSGLPAANSEPNLHAQLFQGRQRKYKGIRLCSELNSSLAIRCFV